MIRSLLYFASVLWGIITLLFLLFYVLGDPTEMVAGQRSDAATLSSIRKELGLDKPIYQQYLYYLNDVSFISVHKNNIADLQALVVYEHKNINSYYIVLKVPYLRRSFQTNRRVTDMYFEKITGTVILACASMLLAIIIGGGLGIFAALNVNTGFDKAATLVALAGISAPSFVVGVMLIWVFAYLLQDYTKLYATGYIVQENILTDGYYIEWKNLLLPAITLGMRPTAIIFQLIRANFLEIQNMDYIRTAWAKGMNKPTVIFIHILRNAFNTTFTAITGWLAALLTGAFFVEYIFDWQGVGKLTIDALQAHDYNLLLCCCLFTGIIFTVITFATDFLYKIIDPRIR